MNILEKIKAHKIKETEARSAKYPLALIQDSIHYAAPTVSMSEYLLRPDKKGIIAEFKRKSPSKDQINLHAQVEPVSIGYMQGGASALSVLTDETFFGGSNEDLRTARRYNYCPILRKDFVVDPYQIHEAKSIGADAILLIAAILTPEQLTEYFQLAHSLNLEVLVEIHEARELEKLSFTPDLIGVNNRDLRSFEVSIENSLECFQHLPSSAVKISESGISSVDAIRTLRSAGYQGFLIGEYFMKDANPALACKKFIDQL